MAFNFDVVISGISGRFPECSDVDIFKKKLYTCNTDDFITTDEKRWKNGFKLHRYHDKRPIPQACGKYADKDNFDFRAFKFNQLMARSTTVLNHKCLEISFEAIVDAGINPASLRGANVGVFVTFGIAEDDSYCFDNARGYVFVLGCARTMGPNRVSYALDLTGPSYASYSDPFGSIQLLTLAKTMIQNGSIEGALVIASHHISRPNYSYLFEFLRFLTHDGICRSFDENANGFVRSEGAVAFFLQREQDAKRIYAKINFSDTLYEGILPHTLLGYDEEYLRKSLQMIYERNQGDKIAADLAFVELGGSAVKKLDTIEANAVADVLFKWRKAPLPVGSIKSLIGHTEPCSPFLSLLKIIFALDSNMIPPNKNFSQPNKDIRAISEKKIQVIDKETELSGNLAAMNSIGLFGAVNHIVLQKNLKESKDNPPTDNSLPRLVLISGRTAEGLQKAFRKISSNSKNANVLAMTNDVFGTNIPFHTLRGFKILSNTKSIGPFVEDRGAEKRPVCFLFSGMGSQWNGMGKELMNLPVFADAIKRCDAVLKPRSIDIYDIILSDDPTMFDNITMSFLAIICIQIALVEVLKKLEIKPDMILGHSVGENGCAYADGCVTLEQAVLISFARGTASNTTPLIKGMMAAVGKGYSEIKDSLPKNIEVACHNSATSCTISGPADDVNSYVQKLQEEKIFARAVNVSNIAYHSKYIQPAAPKLRELLEPLIPNPKKRSSKWISSSVPEEHWGSSSAQTCSAEYFTNNLLSPVLFEEACKHIPKNAVVIEIAPHGLLQAILRRALPETCTSISLTHRSPKQDNLNTLLSGIGRLYIAGCEPAVNNLYPPIEYPVPRGTPSIAPYCTWFYGDNDTIETYLKPFYPVPLSTEKIIVRINEDSEYGFLKYHRINSEAVIPISFFLYLVWRMLSVHKNVKMDDFPILFENIIIHRNVKISVSKPRVITILIQGSGSFELLSRAMFNKKNFKVVLTGRIEFIQDENQSLQNNFALDNKEFECTYNHNAINEILRVAGFQLGKCFQLLEDLNLGIKESTANIQWDGNWVTMLDAALKFQMFSDIQKSRLCYPHTVRRIFISPSIIGSITQGSNICCYYNKVSKEFQCNGIEMNDVKWKIKHPKPTEKFTSSLKLRKLKFVSYNNPSCQTVDQFLELCLQIVTEDFQATNETNLNLNICDNTKRFIKTLQNSNGLKSLTQFHVSYKDLESYSSKKLSGAENLFLITEDDRHLANGHCASVLFVLLIIPKNISSSKISSKFIPLLSQNFSGKMYCLLKKNFDDTAEIPMDEKNANQYHVTNGNTCTKNQIVIRSKLDSSNLSLMLSKKNCANMRYLFLYDTKKSSNDFQAPVISKANLPVSVLKDKEWGSYRYLPRTKTGSVNEIFTVNRCNNIQIESINVECIRWERSAAELSESQSNSEIKLLGVEYSGQNVSGEKVMGLTSVCSSHTITKMDPQLTWHVPDAWKLSEAATVPAIYCHVYSVMEIIENSHYSMNSSIVIITDSQNVFAKSLISLCIAKGLKFYCAVPDEENAKDLKQAIPKLNESNVIINTNNNFDIILLFKTKRQGVNIVVNFSAEFRDMRATMNCVSTFGSIIETVERNMSENNEIGMWAFGMSASFHAIPCKITHFLSLRDDRKIYLQNAIKQGIVDGLVNPVFQEPNTAPVKGRRDQHIDKSSTVLNSKSPTLPVTNLECSPQSLKFVANRSYIIIVGGRRDDNWMKIIHWLRERDASHFVVVVEKFYSNPRISSQMNSLLSNKKITISFQSLNKLNSFDEAARLIYETNKLAPLDSIFFVSMACDFRPTSSLTKHTGLPSLKLFCILDKDNLFECYKESSSKMINYMDDATKVCQGNVKFISIFAGGVEEMETRQSEGRPSFVLHGKNFPKNLPEILTDFEKMLKTFEPTDNQGCLYEILENSNTSDDPDQLTPLRQVLPKNIHTLERIGRNISDKVEFVEMTSRCVKWANCQGVYPIFVIPGLHASELESFYHSLMYPVFCAAFTEKSSSVYETALKLHEHLNHIQKAGPVTLIGETWNAAIAIELCLLVKKFGRDFKLFVLDGNPKEWKNTIDTLNLTESQQFEKVLTKIYGDQILEHLQLWNLLEADKMPNTINTVPNGDEKLNSAHIRRCLNVLKQQFINAHNHHLDNFMIENTVFFFRQVCHDISLVLSDSSDVISVQADDYDNFIRSSVIRKIVNKHARFAW